MVALRTGEKKNKLYIWEMTRRYKECQFSNQKPFQWGVGRGWWCLSLWSTTTQAENQNPRPDLQHSHNTDVHAAVHICNPAHMEQKQVGGAHRAASHSSWTDERQAEKSCLRHEDTQCISLSFSGMCAHWHLYVLHMLAKKMSVLFYEIYILYTYK